MSKEIKEDNNQIVNNLYEGVKKMLLDNTMDKLSLIGFDDVALIDPNDWSKELLDILFLDDRVTADTRKYIFRFHDRDLNNINGDYVSGYKYGRWHELYEFYLLQAISYNRLDLVTDITNNIIDFNMIAINKGKPNTSHYLIKVSLDTLNKLNEVAKDDANRLNEMNRRIDGPTLD